MSDARPIGEIIAPLLAAAAQLAPFQDWINGEPDASARKQIIMDAHGMGLITDDDCTLLLQAYQLETA